MDLDGPYSVRHSLPGSGATIDPTRRARPDSVSFAARTPDGPVAVRARVTDRSLVLETWGDGSGWMADRGPALAGRHGSGPNKRPRFSPMRANPFALHRGPRLTSIHRASFSSLRHVASQYTLLYM